MATEPFKAGSAKLDEKLEGKNNFISWKLRIERYLSIQESADPTYYYSRVIVNARADLARPAANAHDDARGKYDRSVSRTTQFILASVSQEIFMQVHTINHPRDIMEGGGSLQTICSGRNSHSRRIVIHKNSSQSRRVHFQNKQQNSSSQSAGI